MMTSAWLRPTWTPMLPMSHRERGWLSAKFASAEVHQEKGDSGLVDELAQDAGAMAQPDAAAAEEHGFFSPIDDIGSPLEIVFVRADRVFSGPGLGHGSLVLGNPYIQYIGRQFEKNRARPAENRVPEGQGKIFRNPFDVVAGGSPFGDRLDDVDLVQFLECAFEVVPKRMASAKHYQGYVIQIGGRYSSQGVGKTRAGRHQTYSNAACIYRPGLSHHHRRLLVPDVNGSDVVFGKAVQYGFNVSAGQTKKRSQPLPLLLNIFRPNGRREYPTWLLPNC